MNELKDEEGNAQRQNNVEGIFGNVTPSGLTNEAMVSSKKKAYLKNASVAKLPTTLIVSQSFLRFLNCNCQPKEIVEDSQSKNQEDIDGRQLM
jgi:hypothetical protein